MFLSAAPEGAICLRAGREAFVLEDFANLFLVEPLGLNFFDFGIARSDFATGNAYDNHISLVRKSDGGIARFPDFVDAHERETRFFAEFAGSCFFVGFAWID